MFKKNNDNINFKNDTNIENLPIYTMKKDLAKLKDPNFNINKISEEEENDFSEIKNISSQKTKEISDKEKTSPFLTQTDWKQKKDIVKKPKINTQTQSNSNDKYSNTPPASALSENKVSYIKKEVDKGSKKIGVTLLIIGLILIVTGVGGYYFWKTRAGQIISTPNSKKSAENLTKKNPPDKEMSIFSVDKPNYLVIDRAVTDKIKIKKIIQGYGDKVAQTEITVPIEFRIVDEQNNPFSWQDFAQKIGITLPKNILDQLEKDFSLYIYNDNGQIRLGLVIETQYRDQLKKMLLAEEEKLPQELQSLFLTTQYTLKEKASFHNGQYKTTNIRYNNVVSPETLSVDYAVTQNNLVVGTTKMTIRAILDLLQKMPVNSDIAK